jgi:hypothetical protein
MYNLVEHSWNPSTPNEPAKRRIVSKHNTKVAAEAARDKHNRAQDLKGDVIKSYSVEDKDKFAKPKTRIVQHVNPNHCIGPGIALKRPEYENEQGQRTSLAS